MTEQEFKELEDVANLVKQTYPTATGIVLCELCNCGLDGLVKFILDNKIVSRWCKFYDVGVVWGDN